MKRELKSSLFWRVTEASVCDASSQTYWRIGKVSKKAAGVGTAAGDTS